MVAWECLGILLLGFLYQAVLLWHREKRLENVQIVCT